MNNNLNAEIVLAEPRGFCAGVDRAIAIVEQALVQYGAPIYVRHEIVHNQYVVADLRAKGAVFVDELDDVPAGATAFKCAPPIRGASHRDALWAGLRRDVLTIVATDHSPAPPELKRQFALCREFCRHLGVA